MKIEEMKFTDMPDSLQVGSNQDIGRRFNGIIGIWNYWIEHCVKYISFTNAGGIIAVLTFMNSKNIRAVSWSGLALSLFVIGLILVGILIARMFGFMKKNHDNIKTYTREFYKGEITWGEFITKADKLTETKMAAVWLGWASACCFFVGLIIGIISYVTFDCQ
jgi:amino acid transporter